MNKCWHILSLNYCYLFFVCLLAVTPPPQPESKLFEGNGLLLFTALFLVTRTAAATRHSINTEPKRKYLNLSHWRVDLKVDNTPPPAPSAPRGQGEQKLSPNPPQKRNEKPPIPGGFVC